MSEMPKHVAIVMDGNGRWAKQRHLPRIAGHREGAKAVQKAVEFCVKHKIEVLTLFALSVENKLQRPEKEIRFLLSLFLESLQKNTSKLNDSSVKISIIGDRSGLSPNLLAQINQSEQLTRNNAGLNLVIALNYSGRWDITQATKRLALDVANNIILPSDIDEHVLQQYLCLSHLPEPDLLIRTSGEQRISNFLLWQLAYTELYFTPNYWPDFNDQLFTEALNVYAERERRFGKISEQVEKVHA